MHWAISRARSYRLGLYQSARRPLPVGAARPRLTDTCLHLFQPGFYTTTRSSNCRTSCSVVCHRSSCCKWTVDVRLSARIAPSPAVIAVLTPARPVVSHLRVVSRPARGWRLSPGRQEAASALAGGCLTWRWHSVRHLHARPAGCDESCSRAGPSYFWAPPGRLARINLTRCLSRRLI